MKIKELFFKGVELLSTGASYAGATSVVGYTALSIPLLSGATIGASACATAALSYRLLPRLASGGSQIRALLKQKEIKIQFGFVAGGSLISAVALPALGFVPVALGSVFLLLSSAYLVQKFAERAFAYKDIRSLVAIGGGAALVGWAFEILSPLTSGLVGVSFFVVPQLIALLAKRAFGQKKIEKLVPYAVTFVSMAFAYHILLALSVRAVSILSGTSALSWIAFDLIHKRMETKKVVEAVSGTSSGSELDSGPDGVA